MDFREKTERFIRKVLVRKCASPFVILFMERTGSSHLCSVLHHHPDISCRREDFSETTIPPVLKDGSTPQPVRIHGESWYRRLSIFGEQSIDLPTSKRVVQHFHDLYSCDAQACGFKFKFDIQFQLYPEVLAELELLKPNLRVIALSRDNVLKQAVSRQNMLRIKRATNGECNATDSNRVDRNLAQLFDVEPQQVIQYARFAKSRMDGFEQSVRQIHAGSQYPLLKVKYENLLLRQQDTVQDIFRFLGVDPAVPIASAVRKSTPDDLSTVVSNYDELKEAVRGTEFESMV